MTKFVEFQYKGNYYVPGEDDSINIFHDVECADGQLRRLPILPYERPSREYFEMWVDAGFPMGHRISLEELKDLMLTKASEEIFFENRS